MLLTDGLRWLAAKLAEGLSGLWRTILRGARRALFEPPAVAWVALDPVSGELAAYDGRVATQLETSAMRGLRSVKAYSGAEVWFDVNFPGRHEERGAGPQGLRDVRRVELHCGSREVRLHARRSESAGWRLSDAAAAGSRAVVATLDDSSLADLAEARNAASTDAVEPAWVAWASVNPRGDTPCLDVYDSLVCARLEVAFQRGDESLELGADFFNAVVVFSGDRPFQRTARGRRSVRRIEVAHPSDEIPVGCVHGPHGWQHAYGGADPGVVTLPVRFALDALVDARRAAARPEETLREGAMRLRRPGADQRGPQPRAPPAGTEPCWEWCHELVVNAAQAQALPESAWGIYNEEQMMKIEQAFQAGDAHADISVGVRDFEIQFLRAEPGFARQWDPRLRKLRMVRRRCVAPAERARLLRPAAPEIVRGQESCAICCAEFQETAAMPTIVIPTCQHVFHKACAQQLADRGDPCPCCRGAVDWQALLPQSRAVPARRRGSG